MKFKEIDESPAMRVQDSSSAIGTQLESFACEMLKLDKSGYQEVPSNEKAAYRDHLLSAIEGYHDDSIIEEVKRIFNVAAQLECGRQQQDKNRQPLSISIFNFCGATGATYGKVASVLRASFSSGFTKSYVCRLYKAGEVCSKFPSLATVSDIDKLHLISRLDEEILAAQLVETESDVAICGKPINLSSRKELKEHLQEEFPEIFRTRARQTENNSPEQSETPALMGLKQVLEGHAGFLEGDDELKSLVTRCIEVLNQRILAEQDGSQTSITTFKSEEKY